MKAELQPSALSYKIWLKTLGETGIQHLPKLRCQSYVSKEIDDAHHVTAVPGTDSLSLVLNSIIANVSRSCFSGHGEQSTVKSQL